MPPCVSYLHICRFAFLVFDTVSLLFDAKDSSGDLNALKAALNHTQDGDNNIRRDVNMIVGNLPFEVLALVQTVELVVSILSRKFALV